MKRYGYIVQVFGIARRVDFLDENCGYRASLYAQHELAQTFGLRKPESLERDRLRDRAGFV